MIFTERTIKVNNDSSTISNPIILYRGDYNVEVRFTILDCPYKYSENNSTNVIETVDAYYCQLVIKVPNDRPPIFSDIVETKEGCVIFTFSGEMIDESIEVGDYTFQIRLFDANQKSRATIPPVENGIKIREPIAFEDVTTTNEVGKATVGYATTTAGTPEDAFDSEGNYNKTTWGPGDRITAAKLDKMEAGIDGVNKKVASVGESSHTHSNKDILDTITADNVHTHSNKSVIDAITSDMTRKWNKSIPFENSYVSDCDTWLTNGYTKTNTDTAHHPSVCTGPDKWGVLFYISEDANNRTGTQMYFPVAGTNAGRIFTRRLLQGTPGDWNLISTFDGKASGVSIQDTANNFTATNVEEALAELFQFVSNGKTLIASAITDMGVTTLATATFEQMANNIRQITTGTTGTGDYTDISYIESTGTQYINTRIGPTASTKIELVAEMSASKAYDHIFGSDIFMKAQWLDDTGTAIEAVKKNGQNQVSELTLGKHTYVMDMTDTANAITIDGTNYGSNIGHVESTNCSLLLLSGYSGDGTIETEFCGIGKIYSCKIYYEDTLVANMKPVLTKSGTYGLLDTVNNTFYASEVGNFTGPVPK